MLLSMILVADWEPGSVVRQYERNQAPDRSPRPRFLLVVGENQQFTPLADTDDGHPPLHTSFYSSHYIYLQITPLSNITVSTSISETLRTSMKQLHLYCIDPTFVFLLPYPAFTTIHKCRD
ncbi:hypothetical protein EVAR_66374_1 [Eumeta japonica]|uniref:Uncharacterized protein n=1 Tax=Eumeta variegata TaxID=151549 RepID=A0A4C1ZMY7_EUMVA|nr:hypothetical protein EVAR_66374_1 [Eumeta japonica]